MIVDTHCHLNFNAFKHDAKEIIKKMREQDVHGIVVGSQSTTSRRAIDLAEANPDILYAAVALHPLQLFSRRVTEVEFPFTTRSEKFDFDFYKALAQEKKVVAIGECGLDYYHAPDDINTNEWKSHQKEILKKHIMLSKEVGKPLIVHTRAHPSNYKDAHIDALEILKESDPNRVVWHAFGTDPETAQQILDHGYMVSFTGLITYREFQDALHEVVRRTPLSHMMIETDSPYMAPGEDKGKRNTPLRVVEVAHAVADIKKIPVEDVVSETTKNAKRFFNL